MEFALGSCYIFFLIGGCSLLSLHIISNPQKTNADLKQFKKYDIIWRITFWPTIIQLKHSSLGKKALEWGGVVITIVVSVLGGGKIQVQTGSYTGKQSN